MNTHSLYHTHFKTSHAYKIIQRYTPLCTKQMATNNRTGGYDCNFLSEPDDAPKCLICLAVARDPRQHEECGKLFCSDCIEKYGTDKPCPNCKKIGTHFYKDHKSKAKNFFFK